jgi:hypothetical protein
MSFAVPHVAINVVSGFALGRSLAKRAVAEVVADADGWRLRRWTGQDQ